MDIHPDSYDVIVLGTGLPESIVAAAAASSGLTVLHLDAGDVYGSAWASLSPNFFSQHAGAGWRSEQSCLAWEGDREGKWRFVSTTGSSAFSGFKPGLLQEEGALGRPSAYNLDLAGPKLAFSAGPLVDLLLRSGCTSYLEFKGVESTYIWTGNSLAPVPSSQAEVFRDRSLSLVEKRLLMRFLKVVTDQSSGSHRLSEEDLDRPFVDLLREHQLPDSVRTIILYAIAFADSDQEEEGSDKLTARQGLERLALYRASEGRFANAPGAFIYPLYGQGELPQAFCRAAAVKGAVYVLRRPIDAIVLDRVSGSYRGVRTCSGQLLFSEALVSGRALFAQEVEDELTETSLQDRANGSEKSGGTRTARGANVARFVCVTDRSFKSDQSNVLVVFPPGSLLPGLSSVIYALQLGASASVCPQGQFVILLSTNCQDDEADWEGILVAAAQALLVCAENTGAGEDGCSKPKVLWSAFFLTSSSQTKLFSAGLPGQVAVFSMPDHTVDYAGVVREAEETFRKLFPTRTFFASTHEVVESSLEDETGEHEDRMLAEDAT